MITNQWKIVALLAALLALPPVLFAAEHDKWIELSSVDWSKSNPPSMTRLADGNYRTAEGAYLIVRGGKVTEKGRDFRQYRPATRPAASPSAPAGAGVASPEPSSQAGLLLPAVQKAAATPAQPSSSATPARVGTAPQKGIEPDEIDVAQRATVQPASPAHRSMSTRQMMMKLKPTRATVVPVTPSAGGASNVAPKPQEPPKYEIADCGTNVSPMICCHHEQGDGSSCNLFKILCENAGGTAQGDGESAACSDW